MARLRYNLLETTLGAQLNAAATSITFAVKLTAADGDIPTISGGDYIVLVIEDEVLYLTAYTSGATSGTVSRGEEDTTDATHANGSAVRHAPTVADFDAIPFDEAAIVTAYQARSPLYYVALTGDTPLTSLGSSGATWTSAFPVHDAVAEMDRPAVAVGSDIVTTSSTSTGGAAHTWAAWVKLFTLTPTPGFLWTVMARGSNSAAFTSRSFLWGINETTVNVRTFASGSGRISTSGAVTFPRNEWFHVASTYASGTQAHYLNGVAISGGSGNTATGSINNGGTGADDCPAIGHTKLTTTIDANFPGMLAHVAYFPSTLTSGQIATLAAAGAP